MASWHAHWGTVAGDEELDWMNAEPSCLTWGWGAFAEFRVATRPTPSVDVLIHDGVAEEDAALSFVVTVVPRALPLFELEPLHGSAVVAEGKALLLLGGAGCGKSTLAAALMRRGWSFLTDDACALDGEGEVVPGAPLLAPRGGNAKGKVSRHYFGKTVVTADNPHPRPAEPAAVLILDPTTGGEEVTVADLPREDVAKALLSFVRSPSFLANSRRERQLRLLSSLAELPVGVLSFDSDLESTDEAAELAESWSELRLEQVQ